MEFRSIYVTTASLDEAKRIGRALVEERLVACVNIIPGATSIYPWEGEVHEDAETVFFAKTRADLADRAVARIAELHEYDVPCAVALRIEGGHSDYLRWIADETQG